VPVPFDWPKPVGRSQCCIATMVSASILLVLPVPVHGGSCASELWVYVFDILEEGSLVALARHRVQIVPTGKSGTAIAHQRMPHQVGAGTAGAGHQQVHRHRDIDALVEAALAEFLGGDIGFGG